MKKEDSNAGQANLALKTDLIEFSTGIVAAYVGRNQIPMAELPGLIRSVFQAIDGLTSEGGAVQHGDLTPAVPIKKSITDEYIICLEDGAKLKMLKRYLRTHYEMTPEQYKAKWKLPPDYPIVAPAYARKRSAMAKAIGLGRATPPAARGRRKG